MANLVVVWSTFFSATKGKLTCQKMVKNVMAQANKQEELVPKPVFKNQTDCMLSAKGRENNSNDI
jgi:hypothetical protein